jgi:carbon monoxide dehydrogenase subunit G
VAVVHLCTGVDRDAHSVWQWLRRFDASNHCFPGVRRCILEGRGSVRRMRLSGGGEIVERLVRADDGTRTLAWRIYSSLLPVANCLAEIRVEEDGPGAIVRWTMRFDAHGVGVDEATSSVVSLCRARLLALERGLGEAREPDSGAERPDGDIAGNEP